MKAQERHRLKSNELAESIKGLPQYWQEHGTRIMIWAAVILIVLVGSLWWRNSRIAAAQAKRTKLLSLVMQKNTMQLQAAQAAKGDDQDQFAGQPTPQLAALVGPLATLADDAAGSGLGATALLQQAEAIRADLLISNQMISDESKRQLCQRAADVYQKVLRQYGNDPIAAGSAHIGLALIAEDMASWDKAKEIYQQIVSQADGKLAGTIYPQLAKQRLVLLDDISEPIEFPMVAPVQAQTPTAQETDEVGAGTVLAPPATE